MNYYLCNLCGTVFEGRNIKPDEYSYTMECPIATCCGQMFECDEEMLIPVSMLNAKGYYTQFCCSGHIYGNSGEGYILFHNDCFPDTVPKGWYADGNAIRYKFTKIVPIDRAKERHRKIEALMKWCNELDESEEM